MNAIFIYTPACTKKLKVHAFLTSAQSNKDILNLNSGLWGKFCSFFSLHIYAEKNLNSSLPRFDHI